jgi:hypothetical protein
MGWPCAHLEARLSGTPALRRFGLSSVADFVSFGHERFWCEQVRLYLLASTKAVGEWLQPGTDVSDRALRKRAARYMRDEAVAGVFVIHNELIADRSFSGILNTIPNQLIFGPAP